MTLNKSLIRLAIGALNRIAQGEDANRVIEETGITAQLTEAANPQVAPEDRLPTDWSVTCLFKARSTSQYEPAEVEAAVVTVTPPFLAKLRAMAAASVDHDLSEARIVAYPDAFIPEDREIVLQLSELVVVRNGLFWFAASTAVNDEIETDAVRVEAFINGVIAHAGDGPYVADPAARSVDADTLIDLYTNHIETLATA
jgi:hypothetical protein